MTFGLNVTYQMKPGKREEFLAAVAQCGVQEDIRREEGCLQYDFFLSVEDGDKLLLVEKWTSREAQQIHMTQPHMARLMAAKEQYVETVTLETYDL